MRNIVEGGFRGSIFPVNLKYRELAALEDYRNVSNQPLIPDLALICTPPATVPGLIGEVRKLDANLPPTWSRANPVDIVGDAPAERYVQTLRNLLEDVNADAILFVHSPTAIVSSTEIAAAVAPLAQVVDYRRNQDLLMEVPPSRSAEFSHDCAKAKEVITSALARGRTTLSELEAKVILAAYSIPVVDTRVVTTGEQAAQVAVELGFPVALKVLSPEVTHKSDVAGVTLDLPSRALPSGRWATGCMSSCRAGPWSAPSRKEDDHER